MVYSLARGLSDLRKVNRMRLAVSRNRETAGF